MLSRKVQQLLSDFLCTVKCHDYEISIFLCAAVINLGFYSSREVHALRVLILIGGALIGLFIIGGLQLLPEELASADITNRAFVQIPILIAFFASSFHPRFLQFAKAASFLTILSLIYTNYHFIYMSWQLAQFSFSYEGTLLYAFFGFFVFGMTFRYALWLLMLSSLSLWLLHYLLVR